MKRYVLLAFLVSCAKDPLAGKTFECEPATPGTCGAGWACVPAPAGREYAWWCRPEDEASGPDATDPGIPETDVAAACRTDGECDDADPCTDDSCPPTGECVHAPNRAPCDDLNPCTTGDLCDGGKCAGTPDPACQCGADADCGPLEDGDLCNGTLRCAGNACVIDPATIVPGCPDSGEPCRALECVPESGLCEPADLPDDTPCEDGNACSGPDACLAGVCIGGPVPPETCNGIDDDCDGLTDEDPADVSRSGCPKDGVCGKDGNSLAARCVGGKWTCDPSGIPGYEAHPEASCDDKDNDCDGDADEDFEYWDEIHPDKVHKGAGCGPADCAGGTVACLPDHTGLFCDTSTATKPEVCDGLDNDCDGLTDEGFGYQGLPVWKDGTDVAQGRNACTGIGECGVGEPGVVECQGLDAAGCSTNPGGSARRDVPETCNNKDDDCDGLTDDGADATCDDALECTDDTCTTGECVHETAPGSCRVPGCVKAGDSNPENPCLACDPGLDPDGWTPKTDGTGCDADGDGCTFADACKAGECKAGPPKDCSWLDEPCRKGSCQGPSGTCVATPVTDGTGCSDGDACTMADACEAGACRAGPPMDCSQLDEPCRKGVCQSPAGTCIAAPVANGTLCSDGDACTKADECQDGACKGTALPCSDGKDCTDDTCDQKTGCVNVPKAGWCLIEATCVSATSVNPGNACQECEPAKGVTAWSNRPDKTACDDGNACTTADACTAGTCKGPTPAVCDDKNPCTTDSCDPAKGCVHGNAEGIVCDDGNLCTTGDACAAGTCKGTPKACGDGKDCTDDTCDAAGKCVNTLKANWCLIGGATCFASGSLNPANPCQECVVATSTSAWTTRAEGSVCDDGNACTSGDKCTSGTCKGPTAIVCDDKNPCTADSCDKAKGCQYLVKADGTACDNGISCDKNDHCLAGKCIGENLPPEACGNGVDDDCDGAVDEEGGIGCKTYYNDADKDGWGDDNSKKCLCAATGTYTAVVGGDCNDKDAGVHPTGTELCNGKDDDCNGLTDEGEAVGCKKWYIDMDRDSYGIPGSSICRCKPEGNYQALTSGDCADSDKDIRPGAPERCNLIDDDCDGSIDEGADAWCGAHLTCESGRCLPPLVSVPAASFWMGANRDGIQCPSNAADSSANADEVPCHSVSVPQFSIDRFEVTVAIFKACVDAGKCTAPTSCGTYSTWAVGGKEQNPVNCVTWSQAEAFCTWAGRRLCSEAEWELAARGTDGRLYPWGSSNATCDNASMFEGGYGCGQNSTLEVGSRPTGASPFGVMDLAGNVWEWVRDWHHATYSGAPTDGTAWETPSTSNRVLRGGSFYSDAYYVRASVRDLSAPVNRADSTGFRCCR